MFSERLPKTCKNFLELCLGSQTEAERHDPPLKLWYKNSIFHRIVPNGWIQGGGIAHIFLVNTDILMWNVLLGLLINSVHDFFFTHDNELFRKPYTSNLIKTVLHTVYC